jgi:hypothetical protein
MKRLSALSLTAITALSTAASCSDSPSDPWEGEWVKTDGKDDASAIAVFVDASWHGQLIINESTNDERTIEKQVLFTVGNLNTWNSVGRVDKSVITNIVRTTLDDGRIQLDYDVTLLVAWGRRNDVPTEIQMRLPLDMSEPGLQAFIAKYGPTCSVPHELTPTNMFYYWRPWKQGCSFEPAEIVTVTATLVPSPAQTTGKYPEYDKVWEDGKLEAMVIFSKNVVGATTADSGIVAYNSFITALKMELADNNLTTIPADLPSSPGAAIPDAELHATLADGKQVRIVAILTDHIRTALEEDPAFRARYESLTTRADLIGYHGHAGLGSNIRALARAGAWVQGQYVMVHMNGCDTYAYINDALNRAHMQINPDDTTGDKYVDLISNAMPSFFHENSDTAMATIRALLAFDAPRTYEQIFADIDSSHVVLVSGEQDNTFTPGGGGGDPDPWEGMHDSGTLARGEERRWETPQIPAGTYEFAMTGTNDADLYVRIGSPPTTTEYDCRPYKTGSNETCNATIAEPTTIHVMVRGYSTTSTFDLVGRKI